MRFHVVLVQLDYRGTLERVRLVAFAVTVLIGLVEVVRAGAVVALVADKVLVVVGLSCVGVGGTVVGQIVQPVRVTVAGPRAAGAGGNDIERSPAPGFAPP